MDELNAGAIPLSNQKGVHRWSISKIPCGALGVRFTPQAGPGRSQALAARPGHALVVRSPQAAMSLDRFANPHWL